MVMEAPSVAVESVAAMPVGVRRGRDRCQQGHREHHRADHGNADGTRVRVMFQLGLTPRVVPRLAMNWGAPGAPRHAEPATDH